MRVLTSLVLPLIFSGLTWAAAVPHEDYESHEPDLVELASHGVKVLSAAALSAITPYARFASAAYCPSSKVQNWACGDSCLGLSSFEVTLTGGDGDGMQLYYVGYWSEQNAVVIAHQGTDPTKFLSDLTDLNIFMQDLDDSLFPGMDGNIPAHGGFLQEHAQTARPILAEVQRLIQTKGAVTVLTIGHSLGGALAELDALFLTLNLPSDIHIKGVTFGTPRVGGPQYAAFFNSRVSDFKRVNNKKDPVPIVPGRGLGFSHVQGEIHIVTSGNAVACSGNDDASDSSCTIKTVPNIFFSNILDHLGPYNGVMIGGPFCD